MRRIGRSYRYDSAHIPAIAEAAYPPNRSVIRHKDTIICQCYKQTERKKLQASGQQDASHKIFPSRNPSGRRSENSDNFRQENNLWCTFWHSPADPPPSPRDEKSVFVTNYPQHEQTPPEPTAGQRADCRGSDNQFSSRIFPNGTDFLDQLLSQQASIILNFRTEQFRKDESALEAAWSSVRKWCGIFVKELKTPATKYRGLNTVTALLWMKFAPLSMHQFSFSCCQRRYICYRTQKTPEYCGGNLWFDPL